MTSVATPTALPITTPVLPTSPTVFCGVDNASSSATASPSPIEDMRFYLIFVGGIPLIASGIVTSILSFAMFTRDSFTPTTTKLILMTTAIVDCVFLISAIFYLELKLVLSTYYKDENCKDNISLARCYGNTIFYGAICYIINFCEMFRNWLVVLIGIERFLVICYPLHFKDWWSVRRSAQGIVFCAITTTILRIPTLIRRLTIYNDKYKKITLTAKQINSTIDSIFLTVLPVIILSLCSLRIRRAMNNSRNLRESFMNTTSACTTTNKHTKNGKGSAPERSILAPQHTVNKVLTVVLSIFTICGLPFVVFSMLTFLVMRYDNHCWIQDLIFVFTSICWFCSLFFSASNFYVYVLRWSKYRHIIGAMLFSSCSSSWSQPQLQPHHTAHNNGGVTLALPSIASNRNSRISQTSRNSRLSASRHATADDSDSCIHLMDSGAIKNQTGDSVQPGS